MKNDTFCQPSAELRLHGIKYRKHWKAKRKETTETATVAAANVITYDFSFV